MRRFSYATGFSADAPPPPDGEFVYTVNALDAKQAAEQAAEEADRRNVEYPAEQEIFLKDMQTGKVTCFSVYMETIPVYRAVRVEIDTEADSAQGEGKE